MNRARSALSTPTLAFETQGQTQTLPAPGQVSLESSRCLDSSEPLGGQMPFVLRLGSPDRRAVLQ